MKVTAKDLNLVRGYQADWNKYAYEVLNVNLDPEQQSILYAVQHNAPVSVCSGTARSKDYVTGVVALCFLFLFVPSKVICTASTGRQAIDIMAGRCHVP